MFWHKMGDQLPSVALIQHALGFAPSMVDGIFGINTRDAVIDFQNHHGDLIRDGIVGPKTWARLSRAYRCSIINVVDLGDHRLKPLVDKLESYGGNPITPAFRSNALVLIGHVALVRARKEGPIGLLRIYSHGNSGSQNLSLGEGGHWLDQDHTCHNGVRVSLQTQTGMRDACRYPAQDGEGLHTNNFEMVERYLGPLREHFSPVGSIELHGCQVGSELEGQQLLFGLAARLGVPVTAPRGSSRIATDKMVFRFESEPSTWFPIAEDIKTWARVGAAKAAPSALYQMPASQIMGEA